MSKNDALNHSGRGWMLLSLADSRSHAGNDGYDDEAARYYSWDSTVPNHDAVSVGDLVVVWNRIGVVGMSVVDDVTTGPGQKKRNRCPFCSSTSIKIRLKKQPKHRCADCRKDFETPRTEMIDVEQYRSDHAGRWRSLDGMFSAAEMRSFGVQPQSQHSIRPLRVGPFLDAVARRSPQ
ncbi:hypothetical protein [Lolliginicoccus levis]|uniref:hypothetical protein n=1 Tax=Lolliginicoccus levis TaxID=2919542 RepID=UPI00242025E6|nr:hypothetical protein [Lolliginicoccus levis]